MKTLTSSRFFKFLFTLAGFILLASFGFAQQKSDDQSKGKKTITIHVTKEVDGNIEVIDTTVVTDGDFDADAFLEEKGVTGDITEKNKSVEKSIIIRHGSEADGEAHDTIVIDDDQVLVFDEDFDMPPPPMPGMPHHFQQFDMQPGFPPLDEHQFESMIEGMARSFGLGDVMPFGEMKQIVVKKKHNGKKVIITFEDRDEADLERDRENEERVYIFNDDDPGNVTKNEKRVIIKGNPGEKIIINENTDAETDEKQVTVNVENEKTAPAKQQKKVIIIKEEKTK